MKMKKKGKVHPSPSPSPSPPSSSSSHHLNEDHSLSVLKLLPATILVLVSVLSPEDREVLAYLITRGTTTSVDSNKKKTKTPKKKDKSGKNHKPPVFDCECFDCYTNYWLRWDSSPNRELIHDIIDAFENHTTGSSGENSVSSSKAKRGKKREKPPVLPVVVVEVEPVVIGSESHVSFQENSPERLSEADVAKDEEEVVVEGGDSTVVFPVTEHKALARKVLPDVLGLFNSSFWRLWNPNA